MYAVARIGNFRVKEPNGYELDIISHHYTDVNKAYPPNEMRDLVLKALTGKGFIVNDNANFEILVQMNDETYDSWDLDSLFHLYEELYGDGNLWFPADKKAQLIKLIGANINIGRLFTWRRKWGNTVSHGFWD